MKNLLKQTAGVTAIGRHSIKGKTRSGLTLEGKAKATWSGRNLPQGFKVIARAGELPRQRMTARKIVNAYSGSREMRIPIAPELGFQWFKNMSEVEKMIAQKGDPVVEAEWIDEKIPTTILENPLVVGRVVLKNAIQETKNLMSASPDRPFHLNLTSSWFGAAMLKALGIDYRTIKPKRPRSKNPPKKGQTLKETEALLFFHLPDGRTILRFRGHAFDVTRPLEKILNS